jgi:hypothetical protein
MPQKIRIEPKEGYLYVEPSGAFDRKRAEEFIGQILKAVDQHSFYNIFVDIRNISGLIPTISRFELARFWSVQSTAPMKMAILELPGQVQNKRFFENVAVNRGALVKVFTTTPDEALQWFGIGPANKPDAADGK